MNHKLLIFIAYLVLNSCACARNEDPEHITKESKHFIILTNTHHSHTNEINEVLNKAEELYIKIAGVLGEHRSPTNKIKIRLEGDFTGQGPYYNYLGIHLFRYSAQEGGYLAALAHELGHAFREDYYIEYDPYSWDNYPFLDEGLAEYVAQLIDSSKTGFPLYGFNVQAVVGDLVLSNNFIPHEILRAQHHELNDRCNIQAYTKRSTWMQYIDETYGRDTLLSLNYPDKAPTGNFFINTLGVDLTAVDAAWQSWIIQKYNTIPQAEQIAHAFRESTSWYSYCDY